MSLTCTFCGREFPTSAALRGHTSHCSPSSKRDKSKASPAGWNKGLSKLTSEGVASQAASLREAHQRGSVTVWSQGGSRATDTRLAAMGDKVSRTLNRKVAEGSWHNSFSRARTHEYGGHRLYGSWEVALAQHLDANAILWGRPQKGFPYEYKGKVRTYTPDFYLPAQGLYLEVKGYATEKDLAKWAAFPEALRIFFGEDLVSLGLISAVRRTKFNPEELVALGFTRQPNGWERGSPTAKHGYFLSQEPKT